MIAGTFEPSEGTITFQGKQLNGLTPYRISSLGISRTFQNIRLFKNLTVAENVFIGGIHRYESGIYSGLLNLKKSREDKKLLVKRVYETLDFFSLIPLADMTANNLSYGHQRLLEMARAMVSQPKLLLLDEPCAGMNPTETAEVMECIQKLHDKGITTVVIEHDMNLIMGICNRIVVLDHGEKIAEGDSQAIQNNPQVIEAYLGGENQYV